MLGKSGRLWFASLTLLGVLAAQTPATAITLFHIRGVVRDNVGRPLPGTRVYDNAAHEAFAAADGTYALPQESTGAPDVFAKRSDTDRGRRSVNAQLPIDVKDVDFVLRYTISHSLSKSNYSPVTEPSTGTLSVFTTAPLPGSPGQTALKSCVYVIDSRTGATEPATYHSTTSGQARWDWTLTVPVGATQGSYSLRYVAKDCETGVILTVDPFPSASYVVDYTSPTMDPATLFPGENGNTILTSQQLQFTLQDTLSGVDSSTITVKVTNVASGAQQTPSRSSTFIGNKVRVTTGAISLEQNARYAVDVTAKDRVGNQMAFSWNFRQFSLDVAAAVAWIEGTVGEQGSNNVWTFLPSIDVGSYNVTAPATEHSGFGTIGQKFNLDAAYIEYTVLGLPAPLRQNNVFPAGKTVSPHKHFAKAKAESALTKKLSPQTVRIPPISVQFPAGTSSAVLKMPSVPTAPDIAAQSCVLPTGCSSDPLPYYLPEGFAQEVLDDQTEFAEETTGLGESPTVLFQLLRGTPVDAAHWVPVSLDTGLVHLSHDEELIGFLNGVNYGGVNTNPPISMQYSEACASGYACNSRAAAANDTPQTRERCLHMDGTNRETVDGCNQYTVLVDLPPLRRVYYITDGYQAKWALTTQIGFADDRSGGLDNELGMTFRDSAGWMLVDGNRWKSVGYDVYYCDGDEDYTPQDDAHFHVFEASKGGSDFVPIINPSYGMAHPNARQWMESSNFSVPESQAWCRDMWKDGSAFLQTTRAIARSKIYYIDSVWKPDKTQFRGTAVGSFGHVWRSYDYNWAIGFGIDGPGFEFQPYEEEKSAYVAYAKGYEFGY